MGVRLRNENRGPSRNSLDSIPALQARPAPAQDVFHDTVYTLTYKPDLDLSMIQLRLADGSQVVVYRDEIEPEKTRAARPAPKGGGTK